MIYMFYLASTVEKFLKDNCPGILIEGNNKVAITYYTPTVLGIECDISYFVNFDDRILIKAKSGLIILFQTNLGKVAVEYEVTPEGKVYVGRIAFDPDNPDILLNYHKTFASRATPDDEEYYKAVKEIYDDVVLRVNASKEIKQVGIPIKPS